MPRNNKQLIHQRNFAICAEFERLSSIKENGVQKYNYQYILMKLRSKFYLENSTLEKIIKHPPDPNHLPGQMELFG
jgi:hypothetical protein